MTATEKIKAFIQDMNEKGIPLPIFRDPVKQAPSITFTFFVISGVLCLLASLDSIKVFAGINFDEIKEFFDMCSWVYLGRSAIKGLMGSSDNAQNKKEGEQ